MEWQLVAVIGLFVLLVVGVRFTGSMKQIVKSEWETKVDEARNILENRYALGEIDDDEFAHRLQTLNEERRRSRERRRQGVG